MSMTMSPLLTDRPTITPDTVRSIDTIACPEDRLSPSRRRPCHARPRRSTSSGPLKLVTVMCGLNPRILSRKSRSMPVMIPSTMSSVATPIVTPTHEIVEMSERGTQRRRLRM
jgi:hypothetical protein